MKKTLITIVFCLLSFVLGYAVTLKIDEMQQSGEVNLTVTFEDTMEYEIPSNKVMNKDEAMNEWPYIIHLSNKGNGKGLYQIILKEKDDSIKKSNLSYVLLLDDKEVSQGKLSDIQDNILYYNEIEGMKNQDYKLYIWVTNEVESDSKYIYELEFKTIKDGGPGF